jgi:hypothetical protein
MTNQWEKLILLHLSACLWVVMWYFKPQKQNMLLFMIRLIIIIIIIIIVAVDQES